MRVDLATASKNVKKKISFQINKKNTNTRRAQLPKTRKTIAEYFNLIYFHTTQHKNNGSNSGSAWIYLLYIFI